MAIVEASRKWSWDATFSSLAKILHGFFSRVNSGAR